MNNEALASLQDGLDKNDFSAVVFAIDPLIEKIFDIRDEIDDCLAQGDRQRCRYLAEEIRVLDGDINDIVAGSCVQHFSEPGVEQEFLDEAG